MKALKDEKDSLTAQCPTLIERLRAFALKKQHSGEDYRLYLKDKKKVLEIIDRLKTLNNLLYTYCNE